MDAVHGPASGSKSKVKARVRQSVYAAARKASSKMLLLSHLPLTEVEVLWLSRATEDGFIFWRCFLVVHTLLRDSTCKSQMTRDAVELSEQALQFMKIFVSLSSKVCKAQVVPDADELSDDSEVRRGVSQGGI